MRLATAGRGPGEEVAATVHNDRRGCGSLVGWIQVQGSALSVPFFGSMRINEVGQRHLLHYWSCQNAGCITSAQVYFDDANRSLVEAARRDEPLPILEGDGAVKLPSGSTAEYGSYGKPLRRPRSGRR